ncbi:NeuD/PglB/VioB family sugar acetyltransferase [Danxiaibacter flavus]|uniref:NeuD/PglB/VioB family sugar acetyltransferase n=1 Tax=Danxiaibacter flavus TaxID=3049108 RepID=A0ABV3ZJ76_9BACT|nr:NeuD/PglB/VioB family sugar acetyltransferase [Chitinophagaceae bacterium DXS]
MAIKNLLIFPFNGNGREAIDAIDPSEYKLIGFIDDDGEKQSDNYEIFSREILKKFPEMYLLAVPGSPTSFRERTSIISSFNAKNFATVIHPQASIGRDVKVGYNCLIMAGVVITANALIKNHVCILPNSVVHHDSIIEDYTLIGSGVVIAGNVTIGQSCYIGSGTNIKNGIHVGNLSLIGLGSNVISNIEANSVVAGNPASGIHRSSNQLQL